MAVQLALKDQSEAEPLFHLLKQEQDTIEEIGVKLNWLPKPDKKVCVVQHEWEADPMDRDRWPKQHSRMRELLDAFHRAFSKRLRELDASSWNPEVAEGPTQPQ